ncbi:MAG: thermonuclease family protein [Alphaproteobacteria bacterium]|nr:thermonuclease family protein [Alphaproteobacteria bacterium]
MANILALFIVLASLFLPLSARAAEAVDFSALLPPEQVQIAQVIDPLRLRLQDGKIIQLTGIEIPDLDPYEPGERAVAALARLKPLLEGKQARLYLTKDSRKGRINRMGYTLGHVQTGGDNPEWLQGLLIAEGYARARPDIVNPEMAAAMTALENSARENNVGLWADPVYAVRNPDNAGELTGRFGVVEGTIHAVAMNNNTVFLNFGPDWKTDFTIGLDSEVRRAFVKQNIDPLQLGGKTIRVRGWVENYNGPFIRLDDLSKLEFIQEPQNDLQNDPGL